MLQRKIRKSRQNRTRNIRERYFDLEGDRGEERQVLDLAAKMLVIGCVFFAFVLGLILGTIFYQNIKNILLPLDPVALSIEHNLTMLAVGKPEFNGKQTVITHMFKGKPNHVYTIQHTSDLSEDWENGDKHHTTDDGIFHVTFDKNGDQSEKWNRHMFFRVTEITKPETTHIANNVN